MSWMQGLPADLTAAVKAETRGELVKWAARPDAWKAFRAAFGTYLFALPWCAITFTVFGALILAITSGKPPAREIATYEYAAMAAAVIFSGGFVLAGLAMLLMPFWVLWRGRRTVYAITDKRIVTIVTGPGAKVSSIPPEGIVRTERRDGRNGTGTLRIITGYNRDSDGDTVTEAEELYSVPAVRAADTLVEQLRSRKH
ncbi:MAG: hypothetical protein NW216_11205 [Hyphomicrobium sp.]|nr:hypothetical protein [Hyphomicrobium sp.]